MTAKDLLENEEEFNVFAENNFKNIDTDSSGSIDRSELKGLLDAIAYSLSLSPPTEEEVDKMLSDIDLNNDGVVSFEEYKQLLKALLQASI